MSKRTCSHCGKEMSEGFVIDNGMEYYCSEECLHQHYTHEEYMELYDDGEGDTYWTQWEEDEDDDDEYTVNTDICDTTSHDTPV